MPIGESLYSQRKTLDEICFVPDKIISVYSLEKHVWEDSNSEKARKDRKPEIQTIVEFKIDPVRPFLNDILRNMAAPYNPEKKDNPIGQGYWIQAEFGSGKSHLLCFLSALALGNKDAWDLIKEKEQKIGRGKRESLYRFWEDGLEAKNTNGRKGIFTIVKTLVGVGGGAIGISQKGRKLTEYILDAAKEQIQSELGKNLSLYPSEILADRFLSEDLDRYRVDLKKFLTDSRFFEEDEFEDVNDFIRDIQENKSPEYKKSRGNKLWRFYTEYLKVRPQIEAESEEILKHLVEIILNEGYSGVLLVLDEVSLFMKDRDDDQRTDDEKTLVILSNRLAKVNNLPIWTVCTAQQALESKMGVKNIIADDRLKLVKLLEEDKDYYDIVLSRVREIKDPNAITNYFLHYKCGFTWPNSIGVEEFQHFFPFHKPALEVVRHVTYELTTARSAIHFMHQTLKHQIKNKGSELIRLWELFDEAVRYEEDPSGVHAGIAAIKTKRENEYKAYEGCKRQIDGLTKGHLKVHHDKAIKIIQTLFLYHIARTRQQGLTSEEIANSVLIERDGAENPDENIQHYEIIAENLKKELRQIVQNFDEDNRPRYRFDPIVTAIDPRMEFQKARDEAESNEVMIQEAWDHLLALDHWPIKTRQMLMDLSSGIQSIFRDIAPFIGPWEDKTSIKRGDRTIDIIWDGKQTMGIIGMRDFGKLSLDGNVFPPIESDQTENDFAVFVSSKPIIIENTRKLLGQRKDPRLILWTPGELTLEERERLLDFAAYRKLISTWQGKETEDALTVINWVAESLQADLGRITKIVDNSYARGRMDALNNSQIEFKVAGELPAILTPIVERVLTATYESREIKFEPPFVLRKEEGVKVINGIVKIGNIPKGAKPNQDISAAQNFGFGLKIMKKSAEKDLDISSNPFVDDLWDFINNKLIDERQIMKIETVYKNFMGIGGPKDYGLTRRIVQIYLLCLVQKGKIRIGIGSKSGLSFQTIDYSNISSIDFSARILDSLIEIQKLAEPENWEVVRPYLEKLLSQVIPITSEDSIIAEWRKKLRDFFVIEKEESTRLADKAKAIFEILKKQNPYEKDLERLVRLFETDLTCGDDISSFLYGLKTEFGYEAFDTSTTNQTEVDDLANVVQHYRDLKRFLHFETEIQVAYKYCNHFIPNDSKLEHIHSNQQKLADKLSELKQFIDSEVKLKTEVIGKIPPESGEKETLGVLIRDYTSVYLSIHDRIIGESDSCRRKIQALLGGDEIKAFKILEGITALQPATLSKLQEQFEKILNEVFTCPSPSNSSVETQLRKEPVHECGLFLQDAEKYLLGFKKAVQDGETLLTEFINRKLEVFFNPAIRERLKQGEESQSIAKLLNCMSIIELKEYLIKESLSNPDLVALINRHLKRIAVKKVKLQDFQPTVKTLEKDQIHTLVREFQKFLEQQLHEVESDDETLPMIQIE